MFFRRPCSTGWRGGGVGLSPPFKLSIVSRVSDKIRIRIRKKKMRIRNPDCIISVSRFIVCIYLSISIYQSISLSKVHTSVKYHCGLCDFSTKVEYSMRRHRENKHKEDPHNVPEDERGPGGGGHMVAAAEI